MNKAEIESFSKSFILFFLALELLIALIFYMEHKQDINTIDDNIFNEMKVCSFNLNCPKYDIGFENKKTKSIYTLYKDDGLLYSYFNIPDTEMYHLKIIFTAKKYKQKINTINEDRIKQFLLISIIVLFITIAFSLYSISPLRKAFSLSKEFIKDILHDFNTPISAIMLNIKTLEKTKTNYNKIQRIEQSLNTILSLQSNLRSYLFQNKKNKKIFDIKELVEQRVSEIEPLYPTISFTVKGESLEVYTSKESVTRIVDNLISNAGKYNKKDGLVDIKTTNNTLIVSDTGLGIENTYKVFDRFYKEHQRGLGIGLHIVKKICREINVGIKVESKLGIGSKFILNFIKVK